MHQMNMQYDKQSHVRLIPMAILSFMAMYVLMFAMATEAIAPVFFEDALNLAGGSVRGRARFPSTNEVAR